MGLVVDSGQIRRDVECLATADGRMVGTAGHSRAREFLANRLIADGCTGYRGADVELPYVADGVTFTNIIARIPGADASLPPVLVAAHYDTCGPLPGADDNAAAVSILLALVSPLRSLGLQRDVLLAFFDAEEPPHFLTPNMGSVHFYTHQRSGPIHVALVLDLVGHDVPLAGLPELLFITGMESDPELVNVLRATESHGLTIVPSLNRYIGDMSDHHIFRANRNPYLFLSCGRWQHYHAPTDTPEKLSYAKIGAVAALVFELVQRTAAVRFEGPFEGYDTTQAELDFMQAGLGPMLAALGMAPQTRADIDAVAKLFVGRLQI